MARVTVPWESHQRLPQNHRAELVGRLAFGNKIVDHERVSPGPFEALAAYEVTNGLIQRVWFADPLDGAGRQPVAAVDLTCSMCRKRSRLT